MSRHAVNWPRIAATVEEVRQHHGLSDRQLAANLGIANSTLSRLRQGQSLSADNLANILAWLYPHQIPAWVCKIPCSTCGDRLAAGVHCTECEKTG